MKDRVIINTGDVFFKKRTAIPLTEESCEMWINNVLCVNQEGILPAPLLSGFLPSFMLAEQIGRETKGHIQPTVRIIIPTNISIAVNGIPTDIVDRQIAQGTNALRQMAATHFPNVDVFMEQDQPVTADALSVLGELTQFLGGLDEKLLDVIEKSGERRGGEEGRQNAKLYAAHHPFGWSDFYHAAIFEKKPPFTVVNTLPPSEKNYLQIRQHLRAQIAGTGQSVLLATGQRVDVFMQISGRPHYLLIVDSEGNALEPTLDDVDSLTCNQIVAELRRQSEGNNPPWIRDNLKRAGKDFERLLGQLSKGKPIGGDVFIADLLNRAT